jgi:hypothetical protein
MSIFKIVMKIMFGNDDDIDDEMRKENKEENL